MISRTARRADEAAARSCIRPGCGARATTVLRLRPALRAAWLVRLDHANGRGDVDLCSAHAALVTLPTGWRLYDERKRGRVSILSSRAVGGTVRRTRRVAPDDLAALPDVERPLRGTAPPGVEPPAETQGAMTTTDTTETTDSRETADTTDTAETMTAQHAATPADAVAMVDPRRTPLLARAFRNVRRH